MFPLNLVFNPTKFRENTDRSMAQNSLQSLVIHFNFQSSSGHLVGNSFEVIRTMSPFMLVLMNVSELQSTVRNLTLDLLYTSGPGLALFVSTGLIATNFLAPFIIFCAAFVATSF